MAKTHQKLELTWIGKGEEPKLEPRILIENPEYSYGDKSAENMLIHGDNLLALKALEQDFTGKIKCIYIDPPYNTGSAFEHYDDGVEHSIWLNLMKPRLEILRTLMTVDGSVWISIDDNECHYLKVMCDEIFGRKNFVTTIAWEQRTTRENRKTFSSNHEYLLVYAKDYQRFAESRNDLGITDEIKERYKNPDNDPRGAWQSVSINAQAGHATASQFYTLKAPNGNLHEPPKGRCWLYTEQKLKELIKDNRIWFGKDGNGVPRAKKFLNETSVGLTPETLWTANEVGTNDSAKKHLIQLFEDADVFDTPKPESLVNRVLQIASNEGDWVLDSFLGSGTTAAVAQKTKRKWVGIELGFHAVSHCLPRLKKVTQGTEKGGITAEINWEGGSGFKFYSLAPSLLNKDKFGNWIITKEYNPSMLAAAMAKQEGFKYSPDGNTYWKQGKSSEKDFIYTTTQFMTVELLDKIQDEMQPEENLLIACKAYQKECTVRFGNISIKKIPQMLLGKCEFGKDDYSLNIVNLPKNEEDEPDFDLLMPQNEKVAKTAKGKNAKNNNTPNLFD